MRRKTKRPQHYENLFLGNLEGRSFAPEKENDPSETPAPKIKDAPAVPIEDSAPAVPIEDSAPAAKKPSEKNEPEKNEPEKIEPEKIEPEKIEPEKNEPEKNEPGTARAASTPRPRRALRDVPKKPHPEKKTERKPLGAKEILRYAVLFVCIFGFLVSGFFVARKFYQYYKANAVYSSLKDLVSAPDRFQDQYMAKSSAIPETLTILDTLNGRRAAVETESGTFTADQQNLVNRLSELEKINPDTAGWISIEGTVVSYPVVWSAEKNYYLYRDFYGNDLPSGSIFMDERNEKNISRNRNTVIYGHNMSDGSMFASLHDFTSASVFYNSEIQIATTEGIYVYKPFSVHKSDAYENYFETDFKSDNDYLAFLDQMRAISIFETEASFQASTRVITLSTCMSNAVRNRERLAVHAYLVKVIR